MRTLADLTQRLEALHARTAETPLFNPVFQLSLDLSRLIESGELTLDHCAALIAELECDALRSRAERLRGLVAPVAPEANAAALDADLVAPDFAAFRARWERPQLHAVLTAHPTFLLTPRSRPRWRKRRAATRRSTTPPARSRPSGRRSRSPASTNRRCRRWRGRRMRAMRSSHGCSRMRSAHGRTSGPRWRRCRSASPPGSATTWTGGPTSAGRSRSASGLAEKAERLARYVAALEAIDANHPLLGELHPATAHAADRAQDFAADLSDPAALSLAANRLTEDDPRKLLSLAPTIEALEHEATGAEERAPSRSRRSPRRCVPTGSGWAGSISG